MQQDDATLGKFYKAFNSGWKPGEELEFTDGEVKSWFKEYPNIIQENGGCYIASSLKQSQVLNNNFWSPECCDT